MDETGKEIVAGYVAYDRSTWEAYRVMDGDLSRVEASTTGEALENYKRSYEKFQANGWHTEGQYSMTMQQLRTTDADSGEAQLIACGDERRELAVTASGDDAGQDNQHRYTTAVTLQKVAGTWMVTDEDEIGVDQC